MAVYRIGAILRMKREALGITREELCEFSGELCSVQTLYRMENGLVKIKPKVYKKLMECMGELSERNYASVLVKDYRMLNLKTEIQYHIAHREYKKAEEKLKKLEKGMNTEYVRNKQYLMKEKAYVAWVEGKITNEEYEKILWEALKMTIPSLEKIDIAEWPYNEQGTELLFRLIMLYVNFNREEAENLALKLKNSCERKYMEEDYYISRHTVCLVELSKLMSMKKNHERAIVYSKVGIEEYRKQEQLGLINSLLYDTVWNRDLMMRTDETIKKEREHCKKLLVQAYYLCVSQKLVHESERIKKLCENFYPGEIKLL